MPPNWFLHSIPVLQCNICISNLRIFMFFHQVNCFLLFLFYSFFIIFLFIFYCFTLLVDGVEVMNVTPVGSPQKQPAMNDTEKVKQTKSRVNATGDAPHSLPTMDDLNLVGYFRVYLSLTYYWPLDKYYLHFKMIYYYYYKLCSQLKSQSTVIVG